MSRACCGYLCLCLQKSGESDKQTPATPIDQRSSQGTDAGEREEFVLMVDEISENVKRSSEEDDVQLQLEWM